MTFFTFNKNIHISSLLTNYFNLSKKHNKKYTIDLLISNNLYNPIYKFKNIINTKYKYSLISKNHLYITNRKKYLLRWKDKLINKKLSSFLNRKANSLLSIKRTFISLPKVKHTNNIVSLIVNIFNKNKSYAERKLNKISNFILLKNKLVMYNNNINTHFNTNNFFNISLFKNILNKVEKKEHIKNFFKRHYLTSIYLEKIKYNNINLLNLNNIIYNIYGKKIRLNIVNMKYGYLDNNIFTDTILRKLSDRKKRVLKVLKKGLKLIKIGQLNPNLLKDYIVKTIDINHNNTMNYIYEYIENKYRNIYINLKNLHVTGVSLEAHGRLTRRMTASRSVYKLKYKGSLKNMYNHYNNRSSSMLRGLIKSNINSIKRNSKNKNGSFGISSTFNTY